MAGIDQGLATSDEITCTICCDAYTNARDLPCGHTFCLSCLEASCPKQCPECKDENVPEADKLKELTVNTEKNRIVGLEMARRVKLSYKNRTLSEKKENNEVTDEGEELRHEGIICSKCEKKDFTGLRFLCGMCPGYNLCEDCEVSLRDDDHDKSHIFLTLKRPAVNALGDDERALEEIADEMSKAMDYERVQHMVLEKVGPSTFKKLGSVTCDRCPEPKGEINGARFKCGHCKNYDLCQDCEKRSDIVHNPDHVFLKIRHPVNKNVEGINDITLVKHRFY